MNTFKPVCDIFRPLFVWKSDVHYFDASEAPGARASAREKLTRLTKSQFQELSTDVYDELVRREDVEAGRGDESESS